MYDTTLFIDTGFLHRHRKQRRVVLLAFDSLYTRAKLFRDPSLGDMTRPYNFQVQLTTGRRVPFASIPRFLTSESKADVRQ